MDALISHSPRGECGLKYMFSSNCMSPAESLPARGVWIEMWIQRPIYWCSPVTPREGSVDWNRPSSTSWMRSGTSLPARGVWIEMISGIYVNHFDSVTPREGSVDWNLMVAYYAGAEWVTPREGSVDWNLPIRYTFPHLSHVTPREGSVDWNPSISMIGLNSRGHSPRGECGLKYMYFHGRNQLNSHSPRGECGLKCNNARCAYWY